MLKEGLSTDAIFDPPYFSLNTILKLSGDCEIFRKMYGKETKIQIMTLIGFSRDRKHRDKNIEETDTVR
jgi:hypothetical protein